MPGPAVRFDYQSLDVEHHRLYIAHMNANQLVEFVHHGHPEHFERLKVFLLGQSDAPYAVLAQEMNTSEGALKVAIDRLRKRYRELLVWLCFVRQDANCLDSRHCGKSLSQRRQPVDDRPGLERMETAAIDLPEFEYVSSAELIEELMEFKTISGIEVEG